MEVARLLTPHQDAAAIATTPTSISSSSASPSGAPSSTSREGNPRTPPSPFPADSIEKAFEITTCCVRETIQSRLGIYLEPFPLEQWIQDAVHQHLWTEIYRALSSTSEWYSEIQDWVIVDDETDEVRIRPHNLGAEEPSQWSVLRGQKVSKQAVIQTAEHLAKQINNALAIKIAAQCSQATSRIRERADNALRKVQEELDRERDVSTQLREQKAALQQAVLQEQAKYHQAILTSSKKSENTKRLLVSNRSPCPGCGREDISPTELDSHRSSGQCMSRRDFKFLYVRIIVARHCTAECVAQCVAQCLSKFDRLYNEPTSYDWQSDDDPLRVLSINKLSLEDVSSIAWLRWFGQLPYLGELRERLDGYFYACAWWSIYPPRDIWCHPSRAVTHQEPTHISREVQKTTPNPQHGTQRRNDPTPSMRTCRELPTCRARDSQQATAVPQRSTSRRPAKRRRSPEVLI